MSIDEEKKESDKTYKLDDKSKWFFFIIYLPLWAPIWMILTFLTLGLLGPVLLVLIPFLNHKWARWCRDNYSFTLKENEVEVKKGVINKTHVTIGYSRIQNVNIRRGLLSRAVGVSTLQIQTAGSNRSLFKAPWIWQTEGEIRGLDPERAQKFREMIEEKIHNQ